MANPVTTTFSPETSMVPVEPAPEYLKNCRFCLKKHFDEDFLELDKIIADVVEQKGASEETIEHLRTHEKANQVMLDILRSLQLNAAPAPTSSIARSSARTESIFFDMDGILHEPVDPSDARSRIVDFINSILLSLLIRDIVIAVQNQRD